MRGDDIYSGDVYMPHYAFDYTDRDLTCPDVPKHIDYSGYCCDYYANSKEPDGKQPCGNDCYKAAYLCSHMIESVRESKETTYCWYAKGDHGLIGLPCGDECYLLRKESKS